MKADNDIIGFFPVELPDRGFCRGSLSQLQKSDGHGESPERDVGSLFFQLLGKMQRFLEIPLFLCLGNGGNCFPVCGGNFGERITVVGKNWLLYFIK